MTARDNDGAHNENSSKNGGYMMPEAERIDSAIFGNKHVPYLLALLSIYNVKISTFTVCTD